METATAAGPGSAAGKGTGAKTIADLLPLAARKHADQEGRDLQGRLRPVGLEDLSARSGRSSSAWRSA